MVLQQRFNGFTTEIPKVLSTVDSTHEWLDTTLTTPQVQTKKKNDCVEFTTNYIDERFPIHYFKKMESQIELR